MNGLTISIIIIIIILVVLNLLSAIWMTQEINNLGICQSTESIFCPSFACPSPDTETEQGKINCGNFAFRTDLVRGKECCVPTVVGHYKK